MIKNSHLKKMKVILSLLMLFPINAFSQYNFWHGMVSAQKKEYPYGTMGDLVVLSGQTVNLASLYPGVRFFDFKSITINSGGTLLIPEVTTSDFVVIGVKQNLVINGTINGSGRLNSFAGLSSVTIPEESSLTVSTINQAFGGAGGKGGHTSNSDKPGGAGCSSGPWVGVGGGGAGASYFGRSGGIRRNLRCFRKFWRRKRK